jgi:type II secretory pathway predicted ATPase ExeA
MKQAGRMIVTVIDDAHLLEIDTLRKLRLLFEDFPHNHNLILLSPAALRA